MSEALLFETDTEADTDAGAGAGRGSAGPAGSAGSAGRAGSVDDLDAVGALVCAVGLRRTADHAEARLLAVAAHWADLHAVLPGGDAAGFATGVIEHGMELLVPLAGVGTPSVAEFAPAELGGVLSMSTYAASMLVGDALELRHRLPRLWARIMEDTLQVWRARQVAHHTKELSIQAARWVDGQVAPFAHKIGLVRVLNLIDAALIRFDPAAAAKKAHDAADQRGVWLSDAMTDGTRSIRIEADGLDATVFDHTITAIADQLGALGDTTRIDVRRAKAIGVIADPQTVLNLLTEEDHTEPGRGSGTHRARHSKSRRRSGRAKVTLYIHLHESALHTHNTAGTGTGTGTGGGDGGGARGGVGRVEGFGPVSTDQVRDWVGRSDVTITPVLDLANHATVDAYEVPDRMAETVHLRNPCCPFPWCSNLTRNKDNDHINPYVPPADGGPPEQNEHTRQTGRAGQTGADNLAGLCRRHHRLKTHGRWTYTMPEPGIYLWRSPAGRHYLVDHTGTTNLTD